MKARFDVGARLHVVPIETSHNQLALIVSTEHRRNKPSKYHDSRGVDVKQEMIERPGRRILLDGQGASPQTHPMTRDY